MNYRIKNIHAREILDSRGNPTVEVDVIIKNQIIGRAAVPSGASTGEFEAMELRDNDKKRYLGKGVLTAVNNINGEINKALINIDVTSQTEIDQIMIELDGTDNKSRLGANAILGVSMAATRAAAKVTNSPLYEYLSVNKKLLMPVPRKKILCH